MSELVISLQDLFIATCKWDYDRIKNCAFTLQLLEHMHSVHFAGPALVLCSLSPSSHLWMERYRCSFGLNGKQSSFHSRRTHSQRKGRGLLPHASQSPQRMTGIGGLLAAEA